MKSILISFILFISFISTAQDLSGNYTSNLTSFKDDQNSNNSFEEEAKFNIIVGFEDENNGNIAIQDPRIPKKILAYEISEFLDKIEGNGYTIFIYKATSFHNENPIPTKIIFYLNDKSELNLMVSDVEGSQVFHNLKKI